MKKVILFPATMEESLESPLMRSKFKNDVPKKVFYSLADVILKAYFLSHKPTSTISNVYVSAAKHFQPCIHDYAKYLQLMVENGDLIIDHSYEKGKSTKTYSFTDKHQHSIFAYAIVKRKKSVKTDGFCKYPRHQQLVIHQQSILTDRTSIQFDDAIQFLSNKGREGSIDIKKQLAALRAIAQIKEGDIFCKSDVSGRLYHPFTTMPRIFREFVQIDGKHLIGFDIRSAQPFFMLVLSLAPSNILENIEKNALLTLSYYRNTKKNKEIQRLETALTTLKELRSSRDILNFSSSFTRLVMEHDIYSEIQKLVSSELQENWDRDKAKKELITMLNGNPKSHFKYNHRLHAIMKSAFPELIKMLDLIKRHDYLTASTILQMTESTIMLDMIAGGILKEHPDFPLLTLHDCIYTTADNARIVKDAIHEFGSEILGIKIPIKSEIHIPAFYLPHLTNVNSENFGTPNLPQVDRPFLKAS